MRHKLLFGGALLGALAVPLAANAQGVPGGAAHGFYEGGRIAGPIGAVVGGAVGGVVGGVEGVLGVDGRYYHSEPEYGEYRPYRHRTAHHYRRRHSS